MKTHFLLVRPQHVVRLALAGGIGLALAASGCGSSASSTSGLSLSGKLNIPSGAGALYQLRHGMSPDVRTSFSGDSVVCSTLTTPPVTSTTSVDSDGSFTIDITGGANQPMNCNLVNSSGDLLATIVATSTQTNMLGNPQTQDTMAFAVSADLGSISYNPNTGEATVPVSNISQSLITQSFSPSEAFDPTGNWLIGNVDFTLPPGFVGPCPSQGNNCNGPPAGQEIYIKRWNGVSTSDESTPRYGMQIWQDQGAFTACGSVMGITPSQAAGFGIDFSQNGSSEVAFNFATSISINGSSEAISGYEITGAKTEWQMTNNCNSQSISVAGQTYSGYVCGPDSQGYYNASLGGGCVDSSGNPVQISGNWNTTGVCTQSDLGNGYTQWSCPGTYNSQAITCTNTGGTFTSSALSTPVSSSGVASATAHFTNGSPTVTLTGISGTIANGMVISGGCAPNSGGQSSPVVSSGGGTATITMSGNATCTATNTVSFGGYFNQTFYTTNTVPALTLCSSLTSGSLQQEQCYAQYYQQNVGNGHSDACLPRVNTDWSTTDPTKFAEVSWVPQTLPLMNELIYMSAGSAGMRNEQDQIQGVASSQQSGAWVNCHVHEVDSISFTKVDSTHILAQYTASDTTSDSGLPDCVAAYGDTKTKFLFTLTKQ